MSNFLTRLKRLESKLAAPSEPIGIQVFFYTGRGAGRTLYRTLEDLEAGRAMTDAEVQALPAGPTIDVSPQTVRARSE